MWIESIKHLFGFCGEPHPSILWLLGSGSIVLYFIKHNIKWCWKRGCDYCKSKILRRNDDTSMG